LSTWFVIKNQKDATGSFALFNLGWYVAKVLLDADSLLQKSVPRTKMVGKLYIIGEFPWGLWGRNSEWLMENPQMKQNSYNYNN